MRIGVVVLNWNGWPDTLECLESLLRCRGVDGPIVVCDNASDDDSLDRIRDWAQGRLDVWTPRAAPLRALSHPPHPRPIPYVEHDRATAERGGGPGEKDAAIRLVLVRTGDNLGYAGGNNVGMRYLLARGDIDAVWLLNNDTVVDPGAAEALAAEVRRDPRVGLCGSTLLYYQEPDRVQAAGGASYNAWLALPRHIGESRPLASIPAAEEVRAKLAYPTGASMLVTRAFLEEVGLMSEDYFLYFEELDWACRGAGRFQVGYAPESRVYHREGRSTGTDGPERKSAMADYYFLRNRLRVTRRHYPRREATVRLGLLIALANRLRRRQWDRVGMIARIWREG